MAKVKWIMHYCDDDAAPICLSSQKEWDLETMHRHHCITQTWIKVTCRYCLRLYGCRQKG